MSDKKVTRRQFLTGLGATAGAAVLASCTPQVVKETVVVEKPVEKVVEKVVKETVVVEGESKVVEKVVEKVITATPTPASVYIWSYWTPPRDEALRKSLEIFYPSIREVTLFDYKVRVVNAREGTAARVRVVIESRDKEATWGTVGVSENIIQASWLALVDSVEYKLQKLGAKAAG